MAERNPTPKAEFLLNKKAVDAFMEIFSKRETQLCIQTALAQYCRSVSAQDDSASPGASHFKLKGAHEFIQVLMNLGESPASAPIKRADNLDHSK
jgi:hypothetical protein